MVNATSHLPAELLSECLRAADPPTQVCASHVSSTWRRVALSDPCLWDSFECSGFRTQSHEHAMLDMLQTKLLRSQALPFRLRIPDRPFRGSQSDYYARLLALRRLDVLRLALYDGPLDIFTQLNPDMTPLPTLASLRVSNPVSYTYLDSDDLFSARILPNLLRLEAHCISFPAYNEPHRALQHLTCPVDSEGYYQLLFKNFPRLVEVQLIVCGGLTTLPAVSLPRSLCSIVLRPDKYNGLHIPSLLWNGAGQKIPRLALHKAHSLHDVLPLFLASHAHRVELRLNSRDQELELRTLPTDGAASRTWTITPWSTTGEFLGGLEMRGCERLTSISVAIEQLGRLFAAQLDAPGLEILEFRLVGIQGGLPLLAGDGDFFIRAPRLCQGLTYSIYSTAQPIPHPWYSRPFGSVVSAYVGACSHRLQRVVFNAHGTVEDVRAHMNSINRVITDLNWSFRELIVYDAELLESIAFSVPAVFGREIDCSAFARFAKGYTTCETD